MSLWRKHVWIAYLAVFVGVCGHASSEFVAVLSNVAGPELSVWRFSLGGAGLVFIALLFADSRDLLTPLREHPVRLLWLSALGITAGYLLFHWSLDFATVPQVATTVTCIPIFVALTNLWLNQQRISGGRLLSGVAAIIGVALLLTDGYLARLAGNTSNLFGVFLAVGCAAAVAAFTVMMRPLITQYGALRITAITMALGSIGLWFMVGLSWGVWVNPSSLFDRPMVSVGALFTIALWNTTITQFLWIGGLAAVPDITRGSYLFFLKPVIAVALTLLFLNQDVTFIQWMAIFIICGAVSVEMNWKRLTSVWRRLAPTH
ncbi:MAG: DMT family transporter [Gammaproteobacteria bacterium]|nr:DMT family transporter [Gammaproteobacteria bacterium]